VKNGTRALWTIAIAWLVMLLGGTSWHQPAAPVVAIERTHDELAARPPSPSPPVEPPQAETPGNYPYLPGEDQQGSISIGDTSHGSLVHGKRLEETSALGILPKQRARNLIYGSDQLVAMLHAAATHVHRETGRRMWIGHLSRPRGGDIAYSVSHNSGRDADIAYCYRNTAGELVDPTGLLAVSSDGVTNDARLRFDEACTWQVIKALLAFEGATAQYLFMAGSLEGMVIRHAMQRGESAALIERAATLLRQPGGNAAPHNDHLHLRVYCSERDIRGGCRNTGLPHPQAEQQAQVRVEWTEQVRSLLDHPNGDTRRRAFERLVILDDEHAGRALSPDRPRRTRLSAIDAYAKSLKLSAVPLLSDLLDDPDPEVKQRSLATLQAITGRSYTDRRQWRAAWKIMKTASRQTWLVSAFRDAGYRVLQLDHPYTWEIVRALGSPPALSRNAAATLVMLFAHDPPADSDRELCRYWHGWISERRALYELAPAPNNVCGPG
jgi:penicillin-insensitive murein endopeptidase